ncbi:Gp138 family membrane-puncturing spike protein [Acetobacter sicerae]|uniref:Gp138 family membrane-puncturing spike protein n=1 Tax=Acetobacter sicerae TaxID=85325 RepID=UPI0018E963BE|nr:Gp138 family membrane-puncturing spike protein [Acetobacter sicerae]
MALDARQARIWTMLPGVVQSFSVVSGTPVASVKLAVKGYDVDDTGTRSPHDMPVLPHCPVWFPRGGGCSLTFPVSAGDECMVVFSSRSIDEWWQNGEAQPAYDLRRHDLSDGICLAGLTSQVKPLSNINANAVELRTDDGLASIQINPEDHSIKILAPGGLEIDGNVSVKGSLTATGDITGAGISLDSHTHSGVKAGTDETGGPQ